MSTFEIPESRIDYVVKKLKRLKNKASKLGITFDYELGKTKAKRVEDQKGHKFVVEVIPVTIAGNLPAIGGWKFAGKIEHSEEGNVLKPLSKLPIPKKYRKSGAKCDHCKLNRRRKDTFLIRKVGGVDYKQVGRECLKDFTGHQNPAAIADVADGLVLIKDFLETESDFDPSAAADSAKAFYLDFYLTYVAYVVRTSGFVSKSKADESFKTSLEPIAPTATVATFIIRSDKIAGKYTPKESDRETAKKTVEWGKNIDENTSSDYLWNLHVIAKREYVKDKDIYLAASMVPAYHRDLAKGIEAESSTHVGEVGEKIVSNVTVRAVRSFKGFRGTTHMYDMIDDSGNAILWYSSKAITELTIGSKHTLMCTVKEHGEYKGVSQTKVNRCKIVTTGTKAPPKKAKKLPNQKYAFNVEWIGDITSDGLKQKEADLEKMYSKKSASEQAVYDKAEELKKKLHIYLSKLEHEARDLTWSERNQLRREYESEIGLPEAEKEERELNRAREKKLGYLDCKRKFLSEIEYNIEQERKVYGGTAAIRLRKAEDAWIPSMPFKEAKVGLVELRFTAGRKRYPITLWTQIVVHNFGISAMVMSPKVPIVLFHGYTREKCYQITLPGFGNEKVNSKLDKTVKYDSAEEFANVMFTAFFDVFINLLKKNFGNAIKDWQKDGENIEENIEKISTLYPNQII